MGPVVLLGPQRFDPTLFEAMQALDVDGRVAVVTAGWAERESEIDELREHVRCETVNLELYRRYESILQDDPELATALARRADDLRDLQQLYRTQLDHALESARALMRREDGPWVEDHRRGAIRLVKMLDRQHLTRLRAVHEGFERMFDPARREAVLRHRDEIERILASCSALLVAGGHVATLLNRLRIFPWADLLGERPIFAWSAGAMALAERVVLFHDRPPQGAGNAEVLEAGLALHRKIVPLPHATRRLDLEDRARVRLFARRFSPASCIVLDGASRVTWHQGRMEAIAGTRRLTRGGRLGSVQPSGTGSSSRRRVGA